MGFFIFNDIFYDQSKKITSYENMCEQKICRPYLSKQYCFMEFFYRKYFD